MKPKLFWAIILSVLSLVVLFTSVALAAPDPPLTLSSANQPIAPALISSTVTHPVATALAERFDIDYEKIVALHEGGIGFGGIVRAHLMAERLEGTSAEDLLAEFQAGAGWGEIAKAHNLHPGRGLGKFIGAAIPGKGLKEKHQGQGADDGADETLEDGGKTPGPPHTPPGFLDNPGRGKGKNKNNDGNNDSNESGD